MLSANFVVTVTVTGLPSTGTDNSTDETLSCLNYSYIHEEYFRKERCNFNIQYLRLKI